jgi:hypothetical protein
MAGILFLVNAMVFPKQARPLRSSDQRGIPEANGYFSITNYLGHRTVVWQLSCRRKPIVGDFVVRLDRFRDGCLGLNGNGGFPAIFRRRVRGGEVMTSARRRNVSRCPPVFCRSKTANQRDNRTGRARLRWTESNHRTTPLAACPAPLCDLHKSASRRWSPEPDRPAGTIKAPSILANKRA